MLRLLRLPFLLAMATLVFVAGCTVPTSSIKTNPAPSGKTTGDLLALVPDISKQLPRSLQDGVVSGSGASSSVKSVRGRSTGDVTVLNPETISGVRARGYIDLKQQLTANMATIMIKLLKTSAAGKDIPLDQDYKFGIVSLPSDVSGPGGATSMDMGMIRLSRPAADTLEAKWKIAVTYLQNGSPISMEMWVFIRIEGTDPATMKVTVGAVQTGAQGGQPYSIYQSTFYDAALGETTMVMDPEATFGYPTLTVLKNQNGFVSYYQINRANRYVAYANDQMGGVARASSSSYTDSNHNPVNQNSISTEFYDGNGDLVEQQWGSSDPVDTGWLPTSGYNLHDIPSMSSSKPATILIKKQSTYTWNGGTSHETAIYKYSTDGTNFTEFSNPSDGWNYVWKQTGSWVGGDSVYYSSGSDWTGSSALDQPSGTWTWTYTTTTTYKVGYTIPTVQAYLGNQYFMQNTFPLKFLSLDTNVGGNFLLKMKENQTYYWWWNDNGSSFQATGPTDQGYLTADPSHRSSWTNYEFWLENKATAGDADRFKDTNGFPTANPAKGDIVLTNMRNQDFWYWDSAAQVSKMTKAIVVNTTETAPVGFAFLEQPLVNTVKTSLEALFQSIPADSLDPAKLKAKSDQILVMPPLDSFPIYTP